jgi:hypothetical protein
MNLFQPGLVYVLMSVLGSVSVGVGVLMRDVVVLMRGVRMAVSHLGMVVFVRMRCVMGVLLCHWWSSPVAKYVVLIGRSAGASACSSAW